MKSSSLFMNLLSEPSSPCWSSVRGYVCVHACVCEAFAVTVYLNVTKPCMCSHDERETKLAQYKLVKLCITGTQFPCTLLSGLQMLVYKVGNVHKCFLEMNDVSRLLHFLSSDLMGLDALTVL